MTIETCTSSSKRLADTWNWGEQPDRESLERCAAAIVSEQNEVCGDAASTTLFSGRLRRRLVLLKRHFAEAASENASRNRRPGEEEEEAAATEDDPPQEAQRDQRASRRLRSRNVLHAAGSSPGGGGGAAEGLARLGSRAALSFAFAFLRRAWRSGEDGDLCTDLLEESLDALLTLPEASMFHAGALSPVWAEVVERTTRFLRAVVIGDR